MKILGGNQVVFYAGRSGNYELQLTDCLEQLEEYMDENQIYPGSLIRHNIFIDVEDQHQFNLAKPRLEKVAKRRFPMPLIVNIIPHSPAEGKVALESTHIQSTRWNCLFKEIVGGSCQHIIHDKHEVVIGSVQFNRSSDFQDDLEKAFAGMETLLAQCNFGLENLVKQWSYIERMFDDEFKVQRYQIFNDVRTKYFDEDFQATGYPASTEVGVSSGGILIEFFALKGAAESSKTINNPIQKAPHEYSSVVLSARGISEQEKPTTPKVERARFLTLMDRSMIFVSATAAIVGERVTSRGDVKEQTIVILENFKKLTATKNLAKAGIVQSSKGNYTLVKAYVQNKSDFQQVYDVLDKFFTDVPLVLLQADLPRKDILVELEAELLF